MATSKYTQSPPYHHYYHQKTFHYQQTDKQNQHLTSNMRHPGHQRPSSLEKPKKYDYFNKYNQHQLLQKAYQTQADRDGDNHFAKDILIVEKRSNSSSSRSPNLRSSNSPNQRRRHSPKQILIRQYERRSSPQQVHQRRSSPKQILKREYERRRSPCQKTQSKSNKKINPYISVKEGRPITLMNSRSNSQTPKYSSSNFQSVLSAIPSFGNGLSAEIAHQNQILRQQVAQYRTLVTRLQTQSQQKTQEIQILRQKMASNELYHQRYINQLQSEVKTWKARYEILNKDLYEQEIQQQQSLPYNHPTGFHIEQIVDKISEIITEFKPSEFKWERQKQNKFFKFTPHKNLQNKIEQVYDDLKAQLQKKKTLQKFVLNIRQMHKKVEKNNDFVNSEKDLKGLWKWLKKLGALQSCVKEIMPVLGQKIDLGTECEPVQFMELLALRF